MPPASTITSVEPSPKDPNLRQVCVGDAVVATVHSARVEALGLRAGRRWTDRLQTTLQRAAEVDAARIDALRMLSRTAASSGALRTRLVRRNHSRQAVDEALAELARDGWVDDEAFARGVVESVLRRGPAGAVALVARLQRRGIDERLAERIAHEALSARHAPAPEVRTTRRRSATEVAAGSSDAVEDAVRWAAATLRRAGALEPARAARRIAAGLARRGVDEDTIHLVIDRLGLESEA